MNRSRSARSREVSFQALTWLLAIAALYLGRSLLMPIAMAVLITFLLYPIVVKLRHWGVAHSAAVACTVIVSTLAALAVVFLVLGQLVDLSSKLPDYRDNLREKVRFVRSSGGTRLENISGAIEDLKDELSSTNPATQTTTAASGVSVGDASLGASTSPPSPVGTAEPRQTAGDAPVRVEIVNSGPGFAQMVAGIALPLGEPLSFAAATLLLVSFLLLYCDDLRERILTSAGTRQIGLSTAAMSEASQRIGSFLRMQAVVNACYGVLVGIMLMSLGVPNAWLWGVLGGLLRFVPYIGPWIAAAAPILLSLAVSPGWTTPLLVAFFFAIIEFSTNMLLEPWLYGNSSGITSLGVVFAAVFWAWIWGPVGMILAVPLTACLIVVARHVPRLRWFYMLFGSDTTISKVGRFYQRLLVGDRVTIRAALTDWSAVVPEPLQNNSDGRTGRHTTPRPAPPGSDNGASGNAQTPFIRGLALAEACDLLVFPALTELKQDAAAGVVSDSTLAESLDLLTSAVGIHDRAWPNKGRLLCVAVQEEVDDCASQLLAAAAQLEGIPALPLSSHALASEVLTQAELSGAVWIALVQVHPVSYIHRHRLVRALATQITAGRKVISCTFGTTAVSIESDSGASNMDLREEVRHFTSMSKLLSFLSELNVAVDRAEQVATA